MIQERKEQLYAMLFNVLGELTEFESSDDIFDRIVEDFALSAEHHMGQADTFNSMLNTFRHNNQMETIPEAAEATETSMYDAPELDWDSVLEQTDPRKRALMSADSDAFKAFIDQMNFPGQSNYK